MGVAVPVGVIPGYVLVLVTGEVLDVGVGWPQGAGLLPGVGCRGHVHGGVAGVLQLVKVGAIRGICPWLEGLHLAVLLGLHLVAVGGLVGHLGRLQ